MEISRTELMKAYEQGERLKQRFSRFKQENSERIEGVLGFVESGLAAGGISWINGRYGKGGQPVKVMGIELDLLTGGGLLALALFDVGGKQNDLLWNLGRGAFDAWLTREGLTMGYQQQLSSAQPPQQMGTGGGGATTGVAPANAWVGA